jgi:FixJ family two-component response regulator
MTAPAAVVRIVDDDTAYRTALTRLLEAAGFGVRTYRSAGEFLLDETEQAQPGCLLLDLRMPGPSGLDLHEALLRRGNPLPIVYLTACGDVPSTVRAMKAGAVDFLTKPVEREILLRAIHAALAQDTQGRATRSRLNELAARQSTLTARERDVLTRVVAGRLNKQIADELGMAERTVKAHRAQVMEKMRASTLAELVQLTAELRAANTASH